MGPFVEGRTRLALMLVATCGTATSVFLTLGVTYSCLPQISADLSADQAEVQWIGDVYPLVVASLLLPAGVLADRVGRKKALLAGTVALSCGMFLAASATSSGALITALFLSAFGAGAAFPCTLATITVAVAPAQRATAVGIWAAAVPLGGMGGTLIGGTLIGTADSWEAAFVVLGVLAATFALLALLVVPETRDPAKQNLDPLGVVLSTLGIAALVVGIIEAPVHGWTDTTTLAWLAVAAGALANFVIWELRTPTPLLDVRLFREEGVAAAAGAILVVFFGLYAIAFLTFQYSAFALHYSPLRAALAMLPMAVTMVPLAVLGPKLARRHGAKPVVAASLLAGAAGAVIAGAFADRYGYPALAIGLFVFGGIGLGGGPVTEAITARLPAAKQGVASAVNNLTRELGAVFGVAVTGTAFNIGYRHEIAAAFDTANDPVAAVVRESPAAGLAAAAQGGPSAPRYLQAVQDGIDMGWVAAMGTVAGFFVLAWVGFVAAFPNRGRVEVGESQVAEPSSV